MQILIKKQVTPSAGNFNPRGLLLGRTGAGKTTLINSICGTNLPTKAGSNNEKSCIFLCQNNVGDHSFELIDTPGTHSYSQQLQKASQLKAAITFSELNTLFIVLQFEKRFDTLLSKYIEEHQIVDKFEQKIVLIITHADLSINMEQDFVEICETFEDWCENIIFFSEHCDRKRMADLMFACMSNMKKEILQITSEDDFFFKCNVQELAQIHKKGADKSKEVDIRIDDYIQTNYKSIKVLQNIDSTAVDTNNKHASVSSTASARHVTIVAKCFSIAGTPGAIIVFNVAYVTVKALQRLLQLRKLFKI